MHGLCPAPTSGGDGGEGGGRGGLAARVWDSRAALTGERRERAQEENHDIGNYVDGLSHLLLWQSVNTESHQELMMLPAAGGGTPIVLFQAKIFSLTSLAKLQSRRKCWTVFLMYPAEFAYWVVRGHPLIPKL